MNTDRLFKAVDRTFVAIGLTMQVIIICIVPYLSYLAFDREPPLTLYDGTITPNVVHNGDTVEVVWRAKYSGRDCPGLSQRELVDKDRKLFPFLTRARRGNFIPDADDPLLGTVTTPPLHISGLAAGSASYKVTQYYTCNWLQRILSWEIIKPSPVINFTVLPDESK